jgi:GNAT superfamily N-acetyltransferase
MRIVSCAERPDLAELAWERTHETFPEYNNHGDVLNLYWGRLDEERAAFQLYLVESGDVILARIQSLPLRWDGTLDDLPAGIDGAIERGFVETGANVLCAMVIAIPFDHQGRGLSSVALEAMRELAGHHGLGALIAPVRPSWKDRYPLTPIDEYLTYRRSDGLFLDPWLRVHERAGGVVLRPEPESLRITGTVAEWEEWTGMAFPRSGSFWFPGGLAPVAIDRGADVGRYWEPNVWLRHAV